MLISLKELKKFLSESDSNILDISNKNIDNDDCVKEVIEFIRSAKPTQVYLEDCSLKDSSVILISNYLKREGSSIKIISLKNNLITQRGILQLADALKVNKIVETIDIRGNPLSNSVLKMIASDQITGFTKLQSLCGLYPGFVEIVMQHELIASDYELVAADLRKNAFLRFLEISGTENLNVVFETLGVNSSLVKLKVANMSFNDSLVDSLSRVLRSNDTLKSLEFHVSPTIASTDAEYSEWAVVK